MCVCVCAVWERRITPGSDKMCKWTIFIFLFFKNTFDLRLFVPLWLILVVLYFIHNKIMSTIKAATTSQTNCLLGCQVWSSSCLILEAVLERWLFLFKSFPPDWLYYFDWAICCRAPTDDCYARRTGNTIHIKLQLCLFHNVFFSPASTTTAGPDFVDRRCKMQPEKIPNVANFTISLA